MKTYIYSLDCPETKTPKYIGKTINIEQRLAQHIRSNENTKKFAWIKSLKKRGLKPTITIIDVLDSDWDFWEDWYIDYYRFLGFDLKNHKGGGVGGRLSQETKNKISVRLKGKKKSKDHAEKAIINLIPGNNKGKPISVDQREKLFNGLRKYTELNGYPNTKITKETAICIKNDLKKKIGTRQFIANKHNVTKHIVSDISRNKTWKDV